MDRIIYVARATDTNPKPRDNIQCRSDVTDRLRRLLLSGTLYAERAFWHTITRKGQRP
jgi:hypothetical protein